MLTAVGIVLLSGGLDSTAALMWARPRYERLLAVMFDYGQPNRDQELSAAHRVAESYSVPRLRIAVADSLPRGGLLRGVQDDDSRTDGLSPAFVPGRNLVFLTCAAAHASVMFPVGNLDLIIGANGQDAARFPDCRPGALAKLGEALRHGVARQVEIITPWAGMTKTEILASFAADESSRAACAASWSCYRGDGPCGRCGACAQRRDAFEASGNEDRCALVGMRGGDPHRGGA